MLPLPFNIQEEEFTSALEKKSLQDFLEHSIETLGHDGNMYSFAFICRDKEQNILGLVAGRSAYEALHIRYMIVSRGMRKKGLGTALMKQALEKGKSLGCRFVHLETMSFQALGFYKKLGFDLDFTRAGYQGGISLHYLSRSL